MKRLHDKVNVIPLIAKADTLTPEECQLFKKQVFVCVYNMVLENVESISNNEMPGFVFLVESLVRGVMTCGQHSFHPDSFPCLSDHERDPGA